MSAKHGSTGSGGVPTKVMLSVHILGDNTSSRLPVLARSSLSSFPACTHLSSRLPVSINTRTVAEVNDAQKIKEKLGTWCQVVKYFWASFLCPKDIRGRTVLMRMLQSYKIPNRQTYTIIIFLNLFSHILNPLSNKTDLLSPDHSVI